MITWQGYSTMIHKNKIKGLPIKAYREANKDKIKAYHEANKDKIAAYREANKDKLAARQKAYREANKDKLAAWQKAYNEANKDKIAARQKAYNAANFIRLPTFGGNGKHSLYTNGITEYAKKQLPKIVNKVLEDCIKNPRKYLDDTPQ